MDLQTRKLNLISYLAQIQDEGVFDKIESYILQRKSKDNKSKPSPFTIEEFINRIEKSEEDLKKGNFKSQDELEKISENW
jgi:hypothetical protein